MARKSGVEVCLSTDSGFKMKIGGFAQHRELELMCAGGLSATEALKAALANNRTLFACEMAAIAPRQRASFFLVKWNPLDDISRTQQISDVWFQGEQIYNASTKNAEAL
jgi:imidazolonepropionase-like amidohydrolase